MRVNTKILIIFLILLVFIQAGSFLISRTANKKKQEALNYTSQLPIEEQAITHYSYFSQEEFFNEAYQRAIGQTPKIDSKIFGGIVPHHLIVKDKIAAFFAGLESNSYQTIILIGPNHFNQGQNNIILSQANWQTPYGILEPDLKLIPQLSQLSSVGIEESSFETEHSISGLVGFIKKSFPSAKFAPIILKQSVSLEQSVALAQMIYKTVDSKKVLVLASVDFSHYQPTAVADFHDLKSASIINNFDFDRIYNIEIDSAPSIYSLLKYLELAGAQKSRLIFSTNSGQLTNKLDEPTTSHQFFYFSQGEKSDQSPAVNFLFFGDLMLDRYVGEQISQNGLDYVFENLAGKENRFFQGIDLISANLEGVVTNLGAHYAPNMSYDFAFAPELVNQLKKYNFNFFNLANNHFTDQGERGVNETRQNLSQLGFNFSGCPDGEVGECTAQIVKIGQKQIGMAGFSMVYPPIGRVNNQFDLQPAQDIISQLKLKTDLIIVNIHWGVEYAHQFSKTQQSIAYKLIDAGADIIIGHHPHVVQGIEIYQNKPIFYSLGNFIFDQYFSADTQEGLALGVNLTDDNRQFFLFPLQSRLSQVGLMQSEAKQKFLQRLTEWSAVGEEYQAQLQSGKITLFNN